MAKMNSNELLNATLPYMQFIHDYHNDTVNKGLALRQENGEITTVYSRGIPFQGKIYEVPAYDRNSGSLMSEDEAYEKYTPMLESGSLQKKYGDFGIPKSKYNTILNLYQKYKSESDYGNVPESAIKFDMKKD